MPTEKQLENLKKGEKTRFNSENAARMISMTKDLL